MFVKNACMLLIRLFSVPKAPLIARSAGPIVLDIAVPMLLMAATMAPQSIPNCALAGCGAISDTISTSTRSFARCCQNTCRNCHFGSIQISPYLNKFVVSWRN